MDRDRYRNPGTFPSCYLMPLDEYSQRTCREGLLILGVQTLVQMVNLEMVVGIIPDVLEQLVSYVLAGLAP